MDPFTPEDVIRYVAGRNDMVHASYMYACGNRHAEIIYLGVGVEGPDREHGHWIASPFSGPPCKACGASTMHINWQLDQHFREPIKPPNGARYFAVPDTGPDPQCFGSSVFAGEIRTAK
jgi:hypothetical protein